MNDAFVEAMKSGYALDEPAIVIGSPMHEGELSNETRVQVALSMMNRHGLVAGATGTGKTKTLQAYSDPSARFIETPPTTTRHRFIPSPH
jgi:hypothetical protein